MGPKTISINSKKISENLIQDKLKLARNTRVSDIDQAIAIYEEIIEEYPDHIDTLIEIANIYVFLERFEKAYPHLKKAITLKPETGALWCAFGKCLYKLLYFDAAIMAYQKAEELSYNSIQMQLDKAMCFQGVNRYEDALALIERLEKQHPKNNNILQAKSVVGAMMGKVDIASESLFSILETLPGEPSVLYKLSEMGPLPEQEYQLCDPDHKIFKNRKLSWQEKTFLYYSRAVEDHRRKQYDEAFEGFQKANKIIRDIFTFDRQNLINRTDLHIRYFTNELCERFKGARHESVQPIFIVGMPRSGTTLIEQILSSHPEITAGGEVTYISKIECSLANVSKEGDTDYPASMENIDISCLGEFGQQYLDHLQQCSSDTGKFITDKMPTNFLNLGLINLIFPNAKIIHAMRDPIDTCLSCYFKRFVDLEHLSFTFDLEDLGFFYNEYQRLMKHWKNLLQDQMVEIQYEDLVADQRGVTNKMLDFIGVDWNDNCMTFYENSRGVSTSSLHQVRQPMYKGSVGRWKPYEKHLGPLIRMLNQ